MGIMQEVRFSSPYIFGALWWRVTLHDFWTQVAIVALLKVLWAPDHLRAEVCPIVPPWENPRWLD
jgi:hypothetical protein